MKILIKTHTDKFDYSERHRLLINGIEQASIGGSEPEDAIIGRDLIDAHNIVFFMKLAYGVGRKGDQLEIDVEDCETKEEFWR